MEVDDGANGKRIVKMDYPSNSHKMQEKKEEQPKKIEKVIKGSVVAKKKSFSKRLAETFFGEGVDNVLGYVIQDVLIPAVKSTLSDIVSGGVEMLLFGETKGSRRKDRGRSYVSYSNYYKSDRDRDDRHDNSRNRQRHSFDDIILDSRGEAEEVLSHLVDVVEEYGMASIADLYDMVGITGSFTDNKYGWTNLSSATTRRVSEGYLIDLPRAVPLD